MSAFFIIPARAKKSLMNLFADHPPLEQRLAALERLESQLQGAAPTASGPARHPHRAPPGQGPGARPPVRDHDRLRRRCRPSTRSSPPAAPRSSSRRSPRATSNRRSRTWKKSSRATGGESGTTVETEDDSYGYRWMILRNPTAPSVEDLAVGINAVSSSIETAGYGERLLCAVFAFDDAQRAADLLHLQLQARRLVPVRARRRRPERDRARAADQGAGRRRAADRPKSGSPKGGTSARARARSAARSRSAP